MNGKDIFLGLRYIGDDLIEKAEYGQFPTKAEMTATQKKRTGIRRPFLIAAIIAMMLLLVGCAVVYMLSMQGILLGDQTATREVFEYDPDTGEAAAYVGKESYIEQVFTIAGLEDSPANQAAREWFAFTQAYDPDGSIRHEVWGTETDFPEDYDSYHIYTGEMKEKIDEISGKYGLKLAGKRLEFNTSVNACDALGIQPIQSSEHGLFLMFSNAMCWEGGNFYLEYDGAFPGGTGETMSDTYGTVHWNRKDCFSDDVIVIEDTGDWKEWEYTTTSGHKAVITVSPSSSRGYIICDRGEAVLSVMAENQWLYGDGNEVTCLYLTDRQMEQLADTIDKAVQPRIPDRDAVDTQISQNGSETRAGYTVKVKSVKTDGWLARIVLGVTAPEGTVLSRNPHTGFEDARYHIGFLDSSFLPSSTGNVIGTNGGWNAREDNDGLDNTVDLVLEIFVEMEDGSAPFGWSSGWEIWIQDIIGFYWDQDRHDYRKDVLAEAGWHFDIGFNERNGDYREIEFVEDPVRMSAITGFAMDGTDVFGEVEVTSFTLRAMSAAIRYDCGYAADFSRQDMPMYAVMKDGSRIRLQSTGGSTGVTWYTMESHVNVDEVDHILLMDGSRLTAPEDT